MFEVENKKVLFNCLAVYTAPGNITSHIKYNDDMIILYELDKIEREIASVRVRCSNILRISCDGDIIWRLDMPHRSVSLPFHPRYDQLWNNENKYYASDNGGEKIEFDPSTGNVLSREFVG